MLAGATLGGTDLENLANPRPSGAQRAQPGDGGDLVTGSGDAEVDRVEGVVHVDTLFDQRTHILDRSREQPGDLMHITGTGVVVDRAVHDESAGLAVAGQPLHPL